MKHDPDEVWRRIIDDARVSAAEMRSAEVRTQPRGPLVTIPPERYLARVLIRPPARPRRHWLAAASLAILGLGAASWVGARVIWPTTEVAARAPSDYGSCLRIARDPWAPRAWRSQALGTLDDTCRVLLRSLREFAHSSDPTVAEKARGTAKLLLDALRHGSADALAVDAGRDDTVVANLAAAGRADGAAAVDELRAVLLRGLVAIRAATADGIVVEGGLPPYELLEQLLVAAASTH